MSLKQAILAILDLEKGTGYDIVKRFNNSIGHFWSSSHQQVYKELHQLHSDGMLSCEDVTQHGKPDKKVYSLTDKGLDSLSDWVQEPAKSLKYRDPLLIKLYAGRRADTSTLLKEVIRHQALHQDKLRQFESLEDKLMASTSNIRSKYLMPYITLRFGILFEKAWRDWAEEVTALLTDNELKKEAHQQKANN